MKKIFSFILSSITKYVGVSLCLIFFSQSSFSQDATPNPGFEIWDPITIGGHDLLVPRYWTTLDSASGIVGIVTCLRDTDSHHGSYAAKLVTKLVFGQVANGICTTGKLRLTPPYGEYGGVVYHQRPDSIAGWYKYAPATNDSTDIEFTLISTITNPLGYAQFKTGTPVDEYTRFSVPITYYSSEAPDTARWLISSSNGFNAVLNSALDVDDLELVFATGINNVTNTPSIKVTPLYMSGILAVENKHGFAATLSVFDEAGRNLQNVRISSSYQEINLSHLQNGFYFYTVTDERSVLLLSGKFGVKK